MTATSGSNRSPRRKLIFLAVYVVLLAGMFLIAAEIVVRLRGFRPFQVSQVGMKVDPGGSLFTAHPALGYTHRAGAYRVTLPDNYSFTVTHDTNTLRVTHGPPPAPATKESIWVMGCSFTHGWSLNDEDTMPWLLQSALSAYDVKNFGVNGYGTVHSLLQFEEHLKTARKPALVIYDYAFFHDERSAMLRSWRKAVAPYNRLGLLTQPRARIDASGNLEIALQPVEYREWPLMRYSAFVHFLEQKWNQLEDRSVRSHAVSEALVKRFYDECKKQGIAFVVAGITRDADTMLKFCEREGIPHVDIAVNLSEQGSRNTPHDDHPSAKSQRAYATKLEAYLKTSGMLDSKVGR